MTDTNHTNTIVSRFIEPLDVLFLRGNALFGEPGSFGESSMPPWPSVMAGALRSRILVDDGIKLAEFAAGRVKHPSLGTPGEPGSFQLQAMQLARCRGKDTVPELLYPLPASLAVSTNPSGQPAAIHRLQASELHEALATSMALPRIPVLPVRKRQKLASGWWLRQSAWEKVLVGQLPQTDELVHASQLWKLDERVGVGLDPARRSVHEGHLFTSRAIVPCRGTGFAVAVSGSPLPEDGILRLGGDGRGAKIHAVDWSWPEPGWADIVAKQRCCIILTSPGIFAQGWKLPGMQDDFTIHLPGLRGWVHSAALAGVMTVSGWNLARHQPKPAQKAVASASVYWLDRLETSTDALRHLMAQGLWNETCEDPQRRAEGFNRFSFASF